jgi:hypothetical protein
MIAKRQLHQQELLALKHNRVLVGRTWKKIVKVLDFFHSWINQSVACCAYRKFSRRWRQQATISRILCTCMTNLGWFPRKQRKVFSISRRHLSVIAREPKRGSHFQHPKQILHDDTKMVLTSFQNYCQISNINLFKHEQNKNVIDGLNNKLI